MVLRALRYFRPELARIVASFLMVAVGTVLSAAWPLTMAVLIDLFSDKARSGVGGAGGGGGGWVQRLWDSVRPESVPQQILWLTIITLVIRLLKEVLQMEQTLVNIRIGYHGLMHVRCELFKKLQELSIGYHRSQPQGDAIYRLSWDTFGFQSLYNVIFGSFTNVLTLGVMLGLMFSFNWKLTLISLLVVPPLLWTILGYGKVLAKYSTEAKEADSRLTTAIQRSVAAISLVQAFNRQGDEQLRFTSTVQNSIAAWMGLHRKEVLYWLILGVIFSVSSVALFGYGGYLVYKGELTVGLLSAFIAYLQGFYDPLNKLSASGSAYQGAMAGVRRVFEVVDRETMVREMPGAKGMKVGARVLELKEVGFEYKAGSPVLRGVSCTVRPGEMVAFVGSSGVGKTTLLSLLPRFYDPTSGVIALDGVDIREIKLPDLRRHIALVLQENIVLPTTVAENIAYGRGGGVVKPEEIRKAAEMAGALSFIEKLEKGFETEVAEGGGNLSGGQRQRIGIARALLTESPIIVLDEPTSALDPQTEQHITETLESLKGKRTLILVSHRLSTVLKCDQIFVMQEGLIVERGRHEELVARRGVYYAMARHQLQLE